MIPKIRTLVGKNKTFEGLGFKNDPNKLDILCVSSIRQNFKKTYLHGYIIQFLEGLLTSFNVTKFFADVKQTADHGKTDSTREETALFSWMSNMSQGIWFEVPWNPHVSLPGKTKKQLGSGKIDFLFWKKDTWRLFKIWVGGCKFKINFKFPTYIISYTHLIF